MSILDAVVSLLSSMAPLFRYAFNFVLALAFVCTVPCVVRDIFTRR